MYFITWSLVVPTYLVLQAQCDHIKSTLKSNYTEKKNHTEFCWMKLNLPAYKYKICTRWDSIKIDANKMYLWKLNLNNIAIRGSVNLQISVVWPTQGKPKEIFAISLRIFFFFHFASLRIPANVVRTAPQCISFWKDILRRLPGRSMTGYLPTYVLVRRNQSIIAQLPDPAQETKKPPITAISHVTTVIFRRPGPRSACSINCKIKWFRFHHKWWNMFRRLDSSVELTYV